MIEVGRAARERFFWDEEAPSLDECLEAFYQGPDVHSAAMMNSLADVRDMRLLDFACGAGITSAWLAARGARVTALDLSPVSVSRCAELVSRLGLSDRVRPVAGELAALSGSSFDGIAGRHALHHVDCQSIAPQLAALLRPGGIASFVETFDSNPVLRLARRHLVGRLGIPRYGTVDEQPLRASDLAALRAAFGSVRTVVAEMTFMRIFDRQVLRYRWTAPSWMLGAIDDALGRVDRLAFLSYHQIVVCGPMPLGSALR